MPGCCPPQPALGAANVYPLYPQVVEKTGLKSLQPAIEAARVSAPAMAPKRAKAAWAVSTAERTRRQEWLAIGLPHNSSHLFARLPFGDAVQLAALVGTGRMTWPGINAALDAKIKLAVAQLHGGPHPLPDPHDAWEQARRAGEDEIWARYHAKCDAVFADDTPAEETDLWSTELLRTREQTLNRLRSERDRALETLSVKLGPQPMRQSTPMQQSPSAPTSLAAGERDALRLLDASGFVGSHLMVEAIRDLAAPLAGHVERSA